MVSVPSSRSQSRRGPVRAAQVQVSAARRSSTTFVVAAATGVGFAAGLLANGGGGVMTWSDDEEALAKRAKHGAPSNVRAAYDYLVRRFAQPAHDGGWTAR